MRFQSEVNRLTLIRFYLTTILNSRCPATRFSDYAHGFFAEFVGAAALVTRAGLGDAAVLCEILDDDGELADLRRIEQLVFEHGLALASIDDLARLEATVPQDKELSCPSS